MKPRNFVFILLVIGLISGIFSFLAARHIGFCTGKEDGRVVKNDLQNFRAEALKLTDLLQAENSSKSQIVNQAQKVLSFRSASILAAVRNSLKNGDRNTVLEFLPCGTDESHSCAGPDCCCKLESGQSQKVAQSDPEFLKVSSQDYAEVREIHKALESMLNDGSVSDEKIIETVQHYLAKSSSLELRSIEFFISIKPHLTAEQRNKIFCWCTQSLTTK